MALSRGCSTPGSSVTMTAVPTSDYWPLGRGKRQSGCRSVRADGVVPTPYKN